MAKIPFTLKAWLKDKSQKVETRDGRPARIICTDAKADDGACIIALIQGYGGEEAYQFFPDGRAFSSKSSIEDCADLFIVTTEPELSEWELAIAKYRPPTDSKETIQRIAAELLALARKQLQPEIDAEIEKAYENADEVQYRKGREEALKDIPRWKKCNPNTIYSTKCNLIVNGIGRYIILDGYMIDVDRLKKLPGFKEDE